MALNGFFFDVEKWFGSVSQQRMSFSEKGVYLAMLFEEWRDPERSLPDDPQAVADLIAISDIQTADVLAAWPVVRRKFNECERRVGRIENLALEQTRRKQAANYRKRQQAGHVAGKVSAAKRQRTKALGANDSLTNVERTLTNRQRSSTEEKRVEESREEEKRVDETGVDAIVVVPTAAAAALPRGVGQQRPVPGYRRLRIFPFMLDELVAMLGEADYDLDLCLMRIDQSAQVLPAQLWPWLKDYVAADAARHGHSPPPLVPTNKRIAGLMAGGEAFLKLAAARKARETA